MTKEVQLTDLEIIVITHALNHYWNDAHYKLENKKPLGDIERDLLKMQKEITFPILVKFENL